MNREILECYGAYLEGREPRAAPRASCATRTTPCGSASMLQGENLERQVRYWRDLLAGAPALELPTDRPRPPVASQRGAFPPLPLRRGAGGPAARRCASSEAATLNMVLMAGLLRPAAPLHGAGRHRRGHAAGQPPPQGAGGHRRRVREHGGPAACGWRASAPSARPSSLAKRAVLDADRNQDLPFEKLVDELGVARDLSRHPVFQVLYFHHVYAHSHHGMDVAASARRWTCAPCTRTTTPTSSTRAWPSST